MEIDYKYHRVGLIDPVICAKIPNKDEDPELYHLVSELMIHGPCGVYNKQCPCMIDNKCSKLFPKKFRDITSIDCDGFPIYRRRDTGAFVIKFGVKLDNRSVVSYNKALLKRYQAHTNVEWCNQAGSIKYLFKYINKGPDRVAIVVEDNSGQMDVTENVDEIKQFYDCTYLSACEASWRLFDFDVHYHFLPVLRLPFHLPGKHSVIYGADEDLEDVMNKPSVSSSMFLSWFECNRKYLHARELTYIEFPTKFVFDEQARGWRPIKNQSFSLGRIHAASPSAGEAYFLRILINKVKGTGCFEDIRTINNHVHESFRDACYAMGLLDDD